MAGGSAPPDRVDQYQAVVVADPLLPGTDLCRDAVLMPALQLWKRYNRIESFFIQVGNFCLVAAGNNAVGKAPGKCLGEAIRLRMSSDD